MISYVEVIVDLTSAAMDMNFRDTSGGIIRERERHGGGAISNPCQPRMPPPQPEALTEHMHIESGPPCYSSKKR